MGPSWRLGRAASSNFYCEADEQNKTSRTRRADRGPGEGRTTLVGGAAAVLGGGLVASMTRNALVLLLVLALAAPAGADLCTANDPHMGDQAELFRTFAYKPMVLR